MSKLSKPEIVQSLVNTVIIGGAFLILRKNHEREIKKLEIDYQIKRSETFHRAFEDGWDESRRAVHCYCGEHKKHCPLHLDNLYPDAKKKD